MSDFFLLSLYQIYIKQYISNFFFWYLWLISGSVCAGRFFLCRAMTSLTRSSVVAAFASCSATLGSSKNSIIHRTEWMLIPNFALCGRLIASQAFVMCDFFYRPYLCWYSVELQRRINMQQRFKIPLLGFSLSFLFRWQCEWKKKWIPSNPS